MSEAYPRLNIFSITQPKGTRNENSLLVLLLVVVLAGCTFTQHELNIETESTTEFNRIKTDTNLVLSFSDERDSTNIGKRVGGFGAKITAANLMASIEAAVRGMFVRKGYQLVSADASHDASVQVTVRSFSYDVTSSWWTGGEHVSAVLILESKKQNDTLKKVYRSGSERRIFFESFGSEIDDRMNRALRDVLLQIAQDQELEHFLTGN